MVRQVLDGLSCKDTTNTEHLADWVQTVSRWNERMDLTAARSLGELVDLLVADSCVVSRLSGVTAGSRVVDVGAGAGAPGLGVAILRPDVHVTLVEPLAKRVALLRTVVGQLKLNNVKVLRARGEDVEGHFDVAVSRATLPPPEWVDMGKELADRVVVMLAQGEPPSFGWEEDHRYVWPLTGAQRRVLCGRESPPA